MPVFAEGPRIDSRPPGPKETAFAYLDRRAGAQADDARGRIEDWLARYPEQEALAARLRSPLGDQHHSAFFELLLHERLLALGHRIVAIEPKLAHTWKSPDFLVESAEGHRFYLEAVNATQDDLHAVLKRKAARYGALDLPLVVAVNCDQDDEVARTVLLDLWQGPRGAQRRGLSAVLAVERADPWNYATRWRLIRHPDAGKHLPQVDLGEDVELGASLR